MSELCVAGGKWSKASEAQKQGVAKRRSRSVRNDYVSRVQPVRARGKNTLSPNSTVFKNLIFRGVAQLVARQFRVFVSAGHTTDSQKPSNPLKTLNISHLHHIAKSLKKWVWPHRWPQQKMNKNIKSGCGSAGRARRSGRRSRTFKSCHSDHCGCP